MEEGRGRGIGANHPPHPRPAGRVETFCDTWLSRGPLVTVKQFVMNFRVSVWIARGCLPIYQGFPGRKSAIGELISPAEGLAVFRCFIQHPAGTLSGEGRNRP